MLGCGNYDLYLLNKANSKKESELSTYCKNEKLDLNYIKSLILKIKNK